MSAFVQHIENHWKYILVIYVLASLVAAPLFLPDVYYAPQFYSGQVFVFFFTSFMVLVLAGLEKLMPLRAEDVHNHRE